MLSSLFPGIWLPAVDNKEPSRDERAPVVGERGGS
jgi:hypothetical protein